MLLPVLWAPDQSTRNRRQTNYPYILLCTCLDMVEMRICLPVRWQCAVIVYSEKGAASLLICSSVKHKERSWFLKFDVLCKLECWYLNANYKYQLEIHHLKKATHTQNTQKTSKILCRSCYGSQWLQYYCITALIYSIFLEIRNETFSKISYAYFMLVS